MELEKRNDMLMIFAKHVKSSLLSLIQEMAACFLNFQETENSVLHLMSVILYIEHGSLQKEFLDHFQFSLNTPSISTFC